MLMSITTVTMEPLKMADFHDIMQKYNLPDTTTITMLNSVNSLKEYTSIFAWEERKHLPTERWKHENGEYRSIQNRWVVALQVDCPQCETLAGERCYNLLNKTPTKYPHSKREREAHRVMKENSNGHSR